MVRSYDIDDILFIIATNYILIINKHTIWTVTFTVKSWKYHYFHVQVEDEWYDNCTTNVQYVCRFKVYSKYQISSSTVIIHLLFILYKHSLFTCQTFSFSFFVLYVNQLPSQLKKKKTTFPCSLVLAHWNSGKYADVGCFAGKVDKGQMWLFPCFLCLGSLQTDMWRKEEFSSSALRRAFIPGERWNSPGHFSVEE